MPVNFLIIETLERYYYFYGDELKVECPMRSGTMMNLLQVSQEICRRSPPSHLTHHTLHTSHYHPSHHAIHGTLHPSPSPQPNTLHTVLSTQHPFNPSHSAPFSPHTLHTTPSILHPSHSTLLTPLTFFLKLTR